MSTFPYHDRFDVNRRLPERGRSREEILGELEVMAKEEDAFWETGKCSGTMYCGDHDHYHFLNRRLRAVRPRQLAPARHVPELDQVRSRDHRHDARPHPRRGGRPARRRPAWSRPGARAASPMPCSPTASTPRRSAASPDPTSSSPRPPTPPSTRRATSSASSCVARRSIPRPRSSTSDWVDEHIDDQTVAHHRLGLQLRLRHGRPHRRAVRGGAAVTAWACTSTAAWGDSSSPSARSSGTTSPSSTSACPASRPSRPTPTSTATP